MSRSLEIDWLEWAIEESLVPSDIGDQPLIDEREELKSRLEDAEAQSQKLQQEKEVLEQERNTLNAIVLKNKEPSTTAETTYLNIIAALLDCIAGNVSQVEKHPSFTSEAKLIETIDRQYKGFGGLSQRTLGRKFPQAKKSLENS